MPEMPEVETVVRGLREVAVGQTIADFATRQPKAINLPIEELRRRVRREVRGVERRGKAAVLRLSEGDLWVHRGLSGLLLYEPAGTPAAETEPLALLSFADGSRLRMERLFMGYVHLLTAAESAARESALGVDALAPELGEVLAGLAARKPSLGLKALLTDQALVAGIGNVYSDEILHRAGLQPSRKVGSLDAEGLARLALATREVLGGAIEQGGDGSYPDLFGRAGGFRAAVHASEKCGTCGGSVERVGGKGAYFCPRCQR